MRIYCISGKARSGKDTVGQIIKEHYSDKRVLVIHYADLVKYICKSYFDWDGNKDKKGRTLLQYVGTDVVRKQCPDYWVNFVASVLALFKDTWDVVVIPDTRFPNELSKMKESFDNVYSIKVSRNADSGLTEEQKNHSSETSVDDIKEDYTIDNNGTLEELKEKVCNIINIVEK